jgi:N-dimethylarginine dimethylaminohydrolase
MNQIYVANSTTSYTIVCIFSREYDEKRTGEVFNISSTFWRNNIPIYRMKDYNGEEITGTFYQSELQKIDIKITYMEFLMYYG